MLTTFEAEMIEVCSDLGRRGWIREGSRFYRLAPREDVYVTYVLDVHCFDGGIADLGIYVGGFDNHEAEVFVPLLHGKLGEAGRFAELAIA